MKYLIFLGLGLIVLSCNENSELFSADDQYEKGNYQQAAQIYSNYLQLNPNHIKALYNRGRSFEEYNEIDSALMDFNAVLKLDKGHVQANISLAKHQYFRVKNYGVAIQYLNEAIGSDNSNILAYTLRGKSYQKLSDLDHAMDDYNNALKIDSEYADAYYARGSLYLVMKKSKNACSDFNLAAGLGLDLANQAIEKYCK